MKFLLALGIFVFGVLFISTTGTLLGAVAAGLLLARR